MSTKIPGGDTPSGKAGFFTGAGCLMVAVALSVLTACGALIAGKPPSPKRPSAISITQTITPTPSASFTVTARPPTPSPAPTTTAHDRDRDGIPDTLDNDADGDGIGQAEDYDDQDAKVEQPPDFGQPPEPGPVDSAPDGEDTDIPAGATALCEDGTFSYSANRRGTCSHHGGVAKWL